ncbi:hypothetical protein [Tunturibacter empetritectus]|uniref:Uncharacterized protein n=1 Tax=Tunturiibacter lichenicola TaxID=2051959 RepID=A0A7W8N3N0_9BACT|nr:hypothetical protein [Edaphobacter lichenicola]MBB5344359.1 hypothetical protein [Edaphobacter lichenicola]
MPPAVAPVLDDEKSLCLRHIQRAQNQRIQYSKDKGVGSNGECQRDKRGDGEAGRLAQLA